MSDLIYDISFRRRFSVNPYKSLRLPLGSFDCNKDWTDTNRGDPYPVICKKEISEKISDGLCFVSCSGDKPGTVSRVLGIHFPFTTYSMKYDSLNAAAPGGAGFKVFIKNESEPYLTVIAGLRDSRVCVTCKVSSGGEEVRTEETPSEISFEKGMKLIVSFRCSFTDIYIDKGTRPVHIGTLSVPEFDEINRYDTYMNTYAAVVSEVYPGESVSFNAEYYLDGGISQADTRCVCYEDGTPVVENGRVFITFSVRMEAGGFQGVASWNPTTSDFRMEGAIFFDTGDGLVCGDVATALVYDRRDERWLLWACSFSHGHILCHGSSKSDLRFGINVLDVELMPVEKLDESGNPSVSDDCSFCGKWGDEDPDFIYDSSRGVWQLAICRVTKISEERNSYRYFLFESTDPFTGYSYVGQTSTSSETGGSIVTIEGRKYLICGANFDKRSNYYVHPLDNLKEYGILKFDYDDGGFRGWGTVIPYQSGNRIKYYMMTFDRHNGSEFNWSYGNLYVFEADRYSKAEN